MLPAIIRAQSVGSFTRVETLSASLTKDINPGLPIWVKSESSWYKSLDTLKKYTTLNANIASGKLSIPAIYPFSGGMAIDDTLTITGSSAVLQLGTSTDAYTGIDFWNDGGIQARIYDNFSDYSGLVLDAPRVTLRQNSIVGLTVTNDGGTATRIGINTMSPTKTLSINGDVGISGTLTLPGYNPSTWNAFVSSPWLTNGSNIYYTAGTVGIGNSAPNSALALDVLNKGIYAKGGAIVAIKGEVTSNGIAVQGHASGTSGIGIDGYTNIGGTAVRGSASTGFGGYFTATTGTALYVNASGGGYSAIIEGGNVGIGVTTPTNQLHVQNYIASNSGMKVLGTNVSTTTTAGQYAMAYTPSGHSYEMLWYNQTNEYWMHAFDRPINRSIPINIGCQGTPIYDLHGEYITVDDWNQRFTINMTKTKFNKGTANKYLYLDANKEISYVDPVWVNSGSNIYYNLGNVGVNTSSPSAKLDVNGSGIVRDNLLVDDTIKVHHVLYENNYTSIPEEGEGSIGTNGDYIVLQAATDICFATAVYIDMNGKAAICNASSISTCPYAFAIATQAISAGSYGKFMTRGKIWSGSWEYGIGAKFYITSGCMNIGPAAPGASNSVNMPIGFMMGQTILYFMGNINSVEHL